MPLEYSVVLRDGFWPMSRVGPSFEDQFTEASDIREEYDEDEHFIWQARDHLWSLSESIKIYMRNTLWRFVHLKRIDNVLYGLRGLCQVLIPTYSILAVC